MPPGQQLGAQVGARRGGLVAQAPSAGNVGAGPIVPPRGRSNNNRTGRSNNNNRTRKTPPGSRWAHHSS